MRSVQLTLATGLDYHLLAWDGPADADGADTTFVLVHGFSDLAAGWAPLAPLLAAHGRVVAPDLRGHGDSARVGAGGYYHFFDYVADLDDVIRQAAPGRIVLVGHSMGGGVCAYWAGARPERLAADGGRLVLIEGLGPPDGFGGDGPSRTAHWIDAWRAAAERGKPLASLDEAVRRLRRNDELLDEPTARALAEAGTRALPDGTLRWKLDPLHHTVGPYAYRLETARAHWARITCPVLAIDGARSRLNLAADERAARRAAFPDCRHVEIPDAGHAVQRHQPAALAAAILDHARTDPR